MLLHIIIIIWLHNCLCNHLIPPYTTVLHNHDTQCYVITYVSTYIISILHILTFPISVYWVCCVVYGYFNIWSVFVFVCLCLIPVFILFTCLLCLVFLICCSSSVKTGVVWGRCVPTHILFNHRCVFYSIPRYSFFSIYTPLFNSSNSLIINIYLCPRYILIYSIFFILYSLLIITILTIQSCLKFISMYPLMVPN